MRTVLIVNANHDNATSYLKIWMDKILGEIKHAGDLRIIELMGVEANKSNVEEIIVKEKPSIVLFNCHGGERYICGHNFKILISMNDNDYFLNNTKVHAMACYAGKFLGPNIIKIGGLSYIGYSNEFKLITLKGAITDVDKASDPYAAILLNPAFTAIKSMTLGDSPRMAYANSQKSYAETMLKLLASNNSNLNTIIAAIVHHNWSCQVLFLNI